MKTSPIYGDGSQTRSFCYVDDLVEAILRTMEQDETVGPVNIGNPVEFTIRELAEQVLEKVGSSSKLVEMPLPSDDPTQRKARYFTGQTGTRLGAQNSTGGRIGAHDSLFPRSHCPLI